jgi:hypothetical protein
MNSTPNAHDDLIASADQQIASAYEKLALVDEQLARMSGKSAKIERDAARDPPVEPVAQPPQGNWPARLGLIGLLSAACIAGIVVGFVLRSSYGGAMLIGARWTPRLASTAALPSNYPATPAQADPLPVQVAAAEAAPPQTAPLTQTGPQATAANVPAVSEPTQLLQKMADDIANLEQAIEQLKVKQDQIASDNAKAIEQLKAKQEETARLLARISEQSASPKTSPPSAGQSQSPQARIRLPAPPPRRSYPPRGYYDDEW